MEPQRERARLHRLLDNHKQLCTQLVQVDFLARRRIEVHHDPSCIILAAIEPTVDQLLHAPAQRLEQSSADQCGNFVIYLNLYQIHLTREISSLKKFP